MSLDGGYRDKLGFSQIFVMDVNVEEIKCLYALWGFSFR
jgi:hypothetical protein